MKCGAMMKSVDMRDSKSRAAMRLGSSPSSSTTRVSGVIPNRRSGVKFEFLNCYRAWRNLVVACRNRYANCFLFQGRAYI